MKRYIKSYDMRSFVQLEHDPDWRYPVRDGLTPYKNLIPYVGNAEAQRLGDKFDKLIDNNVLDYMPCTKEVVNISDLKTMQPYLVEEGLDSDHKDSNYPFCIKYKGQLYLLNGNHRVAKALQSGKTTYELYVYDLDTYWRGADYD